VTHRLAVIGAGAWGTTLAVKLTAAHQVMLWAHTHDVAATLDADRENRRYLPGVRFPAELAITGDDTALAAPHDAYLLAVPSAHVRATLKRLAPHLDHRAAVLSLVKGIEEGTHRRVSEMVDEEVPGHRVGVLSGPNLAREIAQGRPAGTVVASADSELAAWFASFLSSDRFRVYTNPDVIGVELCGALKNVIALAAGMVDGLKLGDSAKAGIITRGLAEMTRLGVSAGAEQLTFAGLAGVGDLIATCMSPLSRNRRAGELIASGLGWTDAAPQLAGVAEGVSSVNGALELAAEHDVELPIAAQVAAVLHERRPPMTAVAELMGREPRDELAAEPR
jgi:glycerol-3-phosphate dehydrogenase (NAD(P)+)